MPVGRRKGDMVYDILKVVDGDHQEQRLLHVERHTRFAENKEDLIHMSEVLFLGFGEDYYVVDVYAFSAVKWRASPDESMKSSVHDRG